MMKLKYHSKQVITTADLYDQCDPPLIFEVRTRPPREWAILYNEFEKDGSQDEEMARALIALVFLTVSDGETVYPLDHTDHAKELQNAIEQNNPGFGKEFVCNIAWAFGRKYYSYLGDHLGNSLEPLPQLKDNGLIKTPAEA